ncbi:DNA cytosine methyltransferase [Ensifer adhaerens]|uniref:DNA cytosine methyltransferase n=1 Tax=Ensifer adhaerens TaxID=106592 RepID=A0ABY8HCM3_ENSAD|nr:DNA cytosine methyltransferase [Ensifer adhaerens]KDP70268.1 hypothetical protein FA04_28945 [Ensifer adhaerens]WFP89856.1 DNA cytosine methyltransferase [Ensifer adhaerens]
MSGAAYYNEIDPYAAAWLRNLIAAGHIAPGDVDERSIVDVQPDDLKGYTQCHFFAGIGGWSLALRLAGWADDRSAWTGSCPCQPLSLAGQQKGHADERHLWPAFYSLIEECRPSEVFGEQVASPDGREWFAGVRADLEDVGYACGSADLCAAGVGAPHPRQRLYWLAHLNQAGRRYASQSASSTERDGHRADGVGRWIGHWDRDGEQARFADGSTRRTKSGVGIMVDGFPGRVAAVGAFGNAIVPQLAAEFVGAYLDIERLAA